MGLSVVIPTKNEEHDLPRALKSVSFADEILVVDTGSTDHTVKIAKEFGARVVTHHFQDFSSLRNFGDSQASNKWILAIDADNEITPKLKEEITSAIQGDPATYRIGRVNIIFGKKIMHSDWGPYDDMHIRLYHRDLGKWVSDVHEQFITESKPKNLEHFMKHYNYQTVEEYITKINFYSELQLQTNEREFSYLKLFFEPKYDFYKRFFYKLGFFDGYHGLFLSYLQAIYHLVVNVKLYTAIKHDH